MKTNRELFVVSKLTLAVQGALIAMLAIPMVAFADENDVTSLTHPANSINIGAENVSASSDKFGEYNGLNKKGGYLNGDFTIRGGDAYDAFNGGEGTWRWQFKGTDIGTTSRALSEEVSDQGKWNLGLGFDQLRHEITDTFQTPLVGSMGGNNFTLPSNFGFINTGNIATVGGTPVTPNGFAPKGTQILSPTQLADFTNPDVYSERQNATLTAGYNIDRQWSVKFDFNQLVQSGAKLISAGTDGISATATGPSGSNFKGESPLMLMNPTNYKTDTFNLALNWTGEKAYGTASFYSSVFTDNNNSVSFPNPYVGGGTLSNAQANSQVASGGLAYPVNYLSTVPSNTFEQLNVNGGYTFTPTTKLVGGVSYAQNNQDDGYMSGAVMQTGGLPQSSLSGNVVTTHADLKLTNQTTRDLALTAGLKFNERDNRTTSNIYSWFDIGGNTINATNGQNESAVNIPMSNKKTQLELAGDYRINQSNRVHLGVERESINRWCNNALANDAQLLMTAGQIASQGVAPASYAAANSCVQVPDSAENKLVANYKLKASEDVNVNAGYSYANRNSDVNSTYYNPLHAKLEGYNATGYVAFFDASRIEQVLKAGVNWQANDKLSLSVNGRATKDTYPDSTLGVQDGHSESANIDATYNYSENSLVSAYLSWQERQRNLDNGANSRGVVATQVWTNNMTDNSTTIGLNGKQKELAGGKFGLSEDLTYSIDKSNYSTSVPYYVPTATAPTCDSATSLTCGSTPDIKSDMLRLKLVGTYQVSKASKVNVGYTYQRLISTDYYYNALQYGYTATSVMPSNQQAPSYTVNVVSVSYVYNF